MQNLEVKIKRLNKDAKIPTYGTFYGAGADVYAVLSEPVTIYPHETKFISTGFALEIPEGTAMLLMARSGLSSKQGLGMATGASVIDSDYRGELLVPLHNYSNQAKSISGGERIAQMVFIPYYKATFEEVETLSETSRSVGGFGSTGTK